DCPFIVRLRYAFQTPQKLCYVLDYTDGGDLQTLTKHILLLETESRFYMAEIILGLEHMHRLSVVHRDLKPSNILLGRKGHLKISDMRLACDFSMTLPTASIGTHGYMAPEVLEKGAAYDSSADWFSLGCVLHRLLTGHTPFHPNKTDDKAEIDHRTLTMTLELPESFSPDLTSLLKGLLDRDVRRRLGCSRGAADLKSHPFFRKVDWQTVFLQEYQPPLIPPLTKVEIPENKTTEDVESQRITLTGSDQEFYRNFCLAVPDRWEDEVTETVFQAVNRECDRMEAKSSSKLRSPKGETGCKDVRKCIMHGDVSFLDSPLGTRCHLYLHPRDLEWRKKGERR
ncbi:beta-adrenergic receptor kinase 1-like, partial [Heptranchias perlo]|uniref:beta-adrenergic receptor kinase 1-like n=1 Tax=Heptranchias perlo TaxID=212740 RepID=UPI00355A585A